MAAYLVEIADEVTTVLNAATLSLSFTANRVYIPVHNIRELGDLTVSVVPTTLTPSLIDRSGRSMYDYFVDVAIQQSIGEGPLSDAEINAACDPLMLLGEEVISLFSGKSLAISRTPHPRCVDAKNQPVFYPPHLDELRVFTSLVTLNYRLGR